MPASSRIDIEDGVISWYDLMLGVDQIVFEEFQTAEDQLEALMKQNAPWADRTGAARSGLKAEASNENGIITMALSHSVDYGYWLEVIQNGRFAIVGPTLEQEARRITYNAVRRIRYARR